MTTPSDVLVVGASAAGLATVEALRRKGYEGHVTVLGAEPHLPYDRPPLSKQILAGSWTPEQAQLRAPDALSALDAEFVLGDPAARLEAGTRTVHTEGGRTLTADVVVLATGLRPRTLPGQDGLAGVHVLRTLDDTLALRADLLACTRAVVVGDVVVVAFGAAPATEWLSGSGLLCDNGVVCDSRCRAAEGIYAAGDVARWHHEGLDALLRLENRTNATEQAVAVAGNIFGEDRPYTPVPYFWTNQFDARIHVHGTLSADAEVSIVEGDVGEGRFVAQYRQGGDVVGVLGWNMPKQARQRRQEIAEVPALAGGKP